MFSGNVQANCDSCNVESHILVNNNGSCNLYMQDMSFADSCTTYLYSFVDYGNGMTDTIYPGQIIPDVYSAGNYLLCLTANAIKYDTTGQPTMCQSTYCTNIKKRNCCNSCLITADFTYRENWRCELIFDETTTTDSCTSHLFSIIDYGNGTIDTVYPGDTIVDPYGHSAGNYTMCLTAYGQSFDSLGHPIQCISKVCKPVRKNLCQTPGTRKKISTEAHFYPNPTKGIIKVKLNTKGSLLRIFSLPGELVCEIDPQGQELFEIDLSELPKGIYFIEVKYRESTITEKVVLY